MGDGPYRVEMRMDQSHIFDEKELNLDRTGGVKHYWHNLRQSRKCFVSRNFGGCYVMMWAAISANRKTYVVFVEKRWTQRATQLSWNIYCSFSLLFDYFIYGTGRNNFFLMQDNVSVHRSYHSKKLFEKFDMDVLKCPALYTHLKPIENIWGALVRAAYSKAKQFNSVADLKRTIEEK